MSSLDRILPFLKPIEDLLLDPDVTEVMVNEGGRRVFVERDGTIEPVSARTLETRNLTVAIKNIARACGDEISEMQPLLDARLEDGSRVAAMFPPCAVGGPVLTIRKFTRRYSLQDLVDVGALTPGLASELVAAVGTQQNILISGGTGTGKTTLLNALAAHIPERDRIVVIEETAEIHLDKPNVLRLEARRAQAPLGQEAPLPPVTIADLLRAALRHRPDRILVGEVRGAEAFDLLQALNTGHLGSLSTIHANSAEQAFTRLAHCVLASNVALPHRSTREAIALAIHLVVHIARVDGHRRVTELVAVRGYDGSADRFTLETRLKERSVLEGAAYELQIRRCRRRRVTAGAVGVRRRVTRSDGAERAAVVSRRNLARHDDHSTESDRTATAIAGQRCRDMDLRSRAPDEPADVQGDDSIPELVAADHVDRIHGDDSRQHAPGTNQRAGGVRLASGMPWDIWELRHRGGDTQPGRRHRR